MPDPIIELIRQNIVTTLGTVETPAYAVTLIVEEPKLPDNSPARQYLCLPHPGHRTLAYANASDPPPMGHREWFAEFIIQGFILDDPTATYAMDHYVLVMSESIQKALMVDPHRGTHPTITQPDGTTPAQLAHDTWFKDFKPVESNPPGAFVGFYLTAVVHYRHLENDPFAL